MRKKHARRRAARIWVHCIGQSPPGHAVGQDRERAWLLLEGVDRAGRSPGWQAAEVLLPIEHGV